jgi:hypothetical protein
MSSPSGHGGGSASGHMYRPVMHRTLQRQPQGMPSPHAKRSEYYGERGTGLSRPGNFEHQLEGQNYHPRFGTEDCSDRAYSGSN